MAESKFSLKHVPLRTGMLGFGAIFFFAEPLARAASGTTPGANDRLVGLVSGLVLATLVGYALAVCWRSNRDSGLGWALLLLFAIALIKVAAVPLFPGLGIDIGSYEAWALHVTEVGPAHMYQPGYFIDYPPGYLYPLWAAGSLATWVHAGSDALRLIVESPALLADLLLGSLIFVMMQRSKRPHLAYVGLLLFALNPATLYDTLVWGQSDSVLTTLLVISVLTLLEGEYELAWGVAAVAVLVKPQALMVMPVLGLWTLLKGRPADWLRSALAFVALALITIAPFQINHPWHWIFSLYSSTAAYYHETSVNAFNFMALAGGLRQPDSTTFLGLSYFTLGMASLVPLYAYLAWLLWRRPTRETLIYACFLAVFGFFMLAPRMHERYLYPALALVIPLAFETPILMAVFGLISAGFLFNLAYVKHILEASIFFTPHDLWAMLAAMLNVVALAAAAACGLLISSERRDKDRLSDWWHALRLLKLQRDSEPPPSDVVAPPPWLTADTIIIGSLLALAIVTRFIYPWIGKPPEIVFDEVHFVGQARHYLHGEPFLDPHPPLAKLLIALGIMFFGDHPWSWRLANATVGVALVGISYLLGRRMFGSRLAATLAGAFVLGDGMFLVDSRIAVIDIVYLACAALSYLLLFRFVQTSGLLARRRVLLGLGVALGLCLGGKLYIPAITFLLVIGFLVFVLLRTTVTTGAGKRLRQGPDPLLEKRIGGALALVGAVGAITYIAIFIPHYLLGWWGGIADLFSYYAKVVWYEQSVASATHPYASPWWSWILMLRPIAYWQDFPQAGDVKTIWGGGNPALWWGALTAIWIVGVQAIERKSMTRAFLVIGYLAYLVIWIPIGRTIFLYHYMPSVYLGFIALAAVLAECWEGRAEVWEHAALLLTMMPVFMLGIGPGWGFMLFVAIAAAYLALMVRGQHPGRLVSVSFVATAAVLFFYFYPVWTGLPIARAGYYARMWLQGPGIRNWI